MLFVSMVTAEINAAHLPSLRLPSLSQAADHMVLVTSQVTSGGLSATC